MASFIYQVRTEQKKSSTDVKVRIRLAQYFNGKRKEIYAISGIVIPKDAWSDTKGCINDKYTSNNHNAAEKELYDDKQNSLNEIKNIIFQRTNTVDSIEIFTSEWLQSIVDEHWMLRNKIKEEQQKAIEEVANKETLTQYIDRYISEIESNERLTSKHTTYAKGSIKAIKASLVQFKEFQKKQKQEYDFDDIDLMFYKQYTTHLSKKEYKTNSIGKCIKVLKSVLSNAKDEHLHNNEEFTNKKFAAPTKDTDNIYLTLDELKAIMAIDLSNKAKAYSEVRDVFLAGCWIAQRVSDYNNLSPENIVTEKITTIENGIVIEANKDFVLLVQQKTNQKVKIPINSYMKEILTKYNNKLPHVWEQKLNQYIKLIAAEAGITNKVLIKTEKGGRETAEYIPKNELIKSHTARRTGATLMYLTGMDVYDICKITGHTSIQMLRKYIKADELDVANKIQAYNFFK